jgi:hypothetical protein
MATDKRRAYRLRYITALYGFDCEQDHIAVGDTAEARSKLQAIGAQIAGTDDLVAIYIPEGTEAAYKAGIACGRVVGAVRLLPMPAGKSDTDYVFHDLDGSLRWPYGWPCEAVFAPPHGECRYLRGMVEEQFRPGDFAPYCSRFPSGPFKLESKMAKAIMDSFQHADGPQ